MLIKRLQWAGAFIETKGVRFLIDPVYESPNTNFFGKPKKAFTAMEDIHEVDLVLITHLHSDHFDPEFIKKRFGTEVHVLVPKGTEQKVLETGLLNVMGLGVGETYEINGVTVAASYSIDGLGDIQVSWIVKDGEKSMIHTGDTLWHGYWWEMAKSHGPFDVCMLPVNAPVVQEEGMINSGQPICMNPEQAVAAAKVLEAKLLIPIHYGSFHNPPSYHETENVEDRVTEAAKLNNVNLRLLQHNEEVRI